VDSLAEPFPAVLVLIKEILRRRPFGKNSGKYRPVVKVGLIATADALGQGGPEDHEDQEPGFGLETFDNDTAAIRSSSS
jgi:hypothetical protein